MYGFNISNTKRKLRTSMNKEIGNFYNIKKEKEKEKEK